MRRQRPVGVTVWKREQMLSRVGQAPRGEAVGVEVKRTVEAVQLASGAVSERSPWEDAALQRRMQFEGDEWKGEKRRRREIEQRLVSYMIQCDAT